MDKRTSRRFIRDIAILNLIIGLINLVFPANPLFFSFFSLPYAAAAFWGAVYYGRRAGFLSLGCGVLIAAGYLLAYPSPGMISEYLLSLRFSAVFSLYLFLVYLLGGQPSLLRSYNLRLKTRFRELVRENYRLRRLSEAQEEVSRELEERVFRQQESITSLFHQLHKLESLNSAKGFRVLLETVQLFSGADQVSVWEYDKGAGLLKLSESLGWSDDAKMAQAVIPVEDSLEGWVIRNDQLFSVRMFMNYEHLKKRDSRGAVLIIPLHINNRVWGLLSIERMPFVKYNLYTEKLLQIITGLSEPALQRSLDHELLQQAEDIDAETELPLFPNLYRIIDKEIAIRESERRQFSLVIVEVRNYEELKETYGSSRCKAVMVQMGEALSMLSFNPSDLFHYKEDSQMALVLYGVDEDGASLYALEALGRVNEQSWFVNGQEEPLDVILGFAALSGTIKTADDLLNHAEHLLELQKV